MCEPLLETPLCIRAGHMITINHDYLIHVRRYWVSCHNPNTCSISTQLCLYLTLFTPMTVSTPCIYHMFWCHEQASYIVLQIRPCLTLFMIYLMMYLSYIFVKFIWNYSTFSHDGVVWKHTHVYTAHVYQEYSCSLTDRKSWLTEKQVNFRSVALEK